MNRTANGNSDRIMRCSAIVYARLGKLIGCSIPELGWDMFSMYCIAIRDYHNQIASNETN